MPCPLTLRNLSLHLPRTNEQSTMITTSTPRTTCTRCHHSGTVENYAYYVPGNAAQLFRVRCRVCLNTVSDGHNKPAKGYPTA